ncbi:MAG: formylglycine-generating enzyme family protein [Cyclobacteriaceae bacterium]|nr:formylglycine-generating enzyme family protein [Cyclobacteriaceae bacterium]
MNNLFKGLVIALIFITFITENRVNAQKLPKKVNPSLVPVESLALFVDITEISVAEWLAYMTSVYEKYGEGKELKNTYPLLSKLPEKYHGIFESIENFGVYYNMESEVSFISNMKYQIPEVKGVSVEDVKKILELPICSISYEQVQKYIAWREIIVNMDSKLAKKGIKLKARLISPEEWEKIAGTAGPRHPENKSNYPDSLSLEGCYLINAKYVNPCESTAVELEKYGAGAFGVESYWPDLYGLYNIFGGVAEMSSEKGVAKGGSFAHWVNEGFAGKQQSYSGPEGWLGFRCVFEIAK